MKKTVFVHIGTHKTATSSIQNFLNKNRCFLIHDNINYPCFQHCAACHPLAWYLGFGNTNCLFREKFYNSCPNLKVIVEKEISRLFSKCNTPQFLDQ
jgi:hypothetical protein